MKTLENFKAFIAFRIENLHSKYQSMSEYKRHTIHGHSVDMELHQLLDFASEIEVFIDSRETMLGQLQEVLATFPYVHPSPRAKKPS
jgi:hypothetical protein